MQKPISTGLMSFGMSGTVFHGPLLTAHPGFTLYGVTERSKDNAKKKYPDVKIYRSIDELLNDSDIELVVVNTPNETHVSYATKALNAGKHVIVEKPFAITSAEADDLIALAKEKNKMLSVFQNRRWDGDFLTLQKIVREDLVGPIVEAELHYDRYRNYIEEGTWKEESGKGSGTLYNLGSHVIDQALVLFGMPSWIDARIEIRRPGGKVDDYYDIRMEYADKMVILKCSYLVKEEGPKYMLHGRNGSYIKYGLDPQEDALKKGGIPGSAGWGEESPDMWGKLNTETPALKFNGTYKTLPGNYLAFYDSIYETIRNGKPLEVKPEESRDVMLLTELAMESSKLKKAIAIKER